MSFTPIHCDQQQYLQVLDYLKQFNQHDKAHGKLIIKSTEKGAVPATAQKTNVFLRPFERFYLPQNERLHNVAHFILEFFKANQDLAKKNALSTIRVMAALSSVLLKDPSIKKEFNQLISQFKQEEKKQEVDILQNAMATQSKIKVKALQDKSAIEQETRSEAQRILSEAENKRKEILEENHSIIEEMFVNLSKLKEEVHQKIETLTKSLLGLQQETEKFYDTIIHTAGGGKIYTNLSTLERVPFFRDVSVYKDKLTRQAISITEEDKSLHPNLAISVDLTEYSEIAVKSFVDFIQNPENLKEIKEFETLIELYTMAQYFRLESLQNAVLEILSKEHIQDPYKSLVILTGPYASKDPLPQKVYHTVADHFTELANLEEFLDVKLDHMIHLLKLNNIEVEDEYTLYEILKKWAQASFPGQDLSTVFNQKVENERLIDHLRLENFTKEQFNTFKRDNILSSQELVKWNRFFLGDIKAVPELRNLRSEITVKKQADGSFEIRWIISPNRRTAKDLYEPFMAPAIPLEGESHLLRLVGVRLFNDMLPKQEGDFSFSVESSGPAQLNYVEIGERKFFPPYLSIFNKRANNVHVPQGWIQTDDQKPFIVKYNIRLL